MDSPKDPALGLWNVCGFGRWAIPLLSRRGTSNIVLADISGPRPAILVSDRVHKSDVCVATPLELTGTIAA
jgi:hypothetical protein